jgi:hypothetical protein
MSGGPRDARVRQTHRRTNRARHPGMVAVADMAPVCALGAGNASERPSRPIVERRERRQLLRHHSDASREVVEKFCLDPDSLLADNSDAGTDTDRIGPIPIGKARCSDA